MPTIVERTPYDRNEPTPTGRLATSPRGGYAVVLQDCRVRAALADALDHIEDWLRRRPLKLRASPLARAPSYVAVELAPVRVNAIHPGIVADTPAWREAPAEFLESVREATPSRALVKIPDVVNASLVLLQNPALNGVNLNVDGGSSLM